MGWVFCDHLLPIFEVSKVMLVVQSSGLWDDIHLRCSWFRNPTRASWHGEILPLFFFLQFFGWFYISNWWLAGFLEKSDVPLKTGSFLPATSTHFCVGFRVKQILNFRDNTHARWFKVTLILYLLVGGHQQPLGHKELSARWFSSWPFDSRSLEVTSLNL